MLACGAQVVATSNRGDRTIPVTDLFVDLFTSALEPDELLTEVRVPRYTGPAGGTYLKLERKVGDYATAAAAAQVTLSAAGAIERVGLGLTNAGPIPVQPTAAEKYLTGKSPTDEVIAEASRLAGQAAQPTADRRGAVEYKQEMARVLAGRALKLAIQRAGGH
jgi:carbon-monoxide dehydrogenase medium subunit